MQFMRLEMQTKHRTENLKVRDRLGDLGVEGRIIKTGVREERRAAVNWMKITGNGVPMTGFCDHANEHSDSIKLDNFLDS
jgi:hypothetical protein